mgnify:CR=1 FL=1
MCPIPSAGARVGARGGARAGADAGGGLAVTVQGDPLCLPMTSVQCNGSRLYTVEQVCANTAVCGESGLLAGPRPVVSHRHRHHTRPQPLPPPRPALSPLSEPRPAHGARQPPPLWLPHGSRSLPRYPSARPGAPPAPLAWAISLRSCSEAGMVAVDL